MGLYKEVRTDGPSFIVNVFIIYVYFSDEISVYIVTASL